MQKFWYDLLSPKRFVFFLVLILLLAFFLRTWNIDDIPGGLYPDEAMNGTNAIEANETGHYKLFYEDNFGREGLFINLQALAIKYLGVSIPALKLWSAIFGALTALGIGLLALELFGRRSAALAAAFITATSYWAINFSRIGFRAIMTAFLLSFSFYFFFKGLRTEQKRYFLFAGLIFGLGLHTYIAFRLAPGILILLLPFLLLSYEHFLKRFWKHAFLFVFGAFLTAAPMFYDFATTNHFASRSDDVSIFSEKINKGDLLGTFGKTFGLSLIKYNFVGDQNFRHNYPPYPVLDPIVGTFFLAGFLWLLVDTIKLLGLRFRNKERHPRLVINAFLFISFFVMLAPEYLTNEGLPHALRAIGTQVPVFLFAAFPIAFLFNRALHAQAIGRSLFLSLFFLTLLGSGLWNGVKYFYFFANHPKQYESFSARFRSMSLYLNSLPENTHKYLYANTGYIDLQAILFQTYGRAKNFQVLQPDTKIEQPAVILQMRYDDRVFENIKRRIPSAIVKQADPLQKPGTSFLVIEIPGEKK